MDKKDTGSYAKGYRLGYLDGYRDGAGQECPLEIPDLPLEYLGLSARARNSLTQAGMTRIRDVASANRTRIRYMRQLGPKSADEVARALQAMGIRGTDWDLFLL